MGRVEHRGLVALALVGCTPEGPPRGDPPPTWVYAPTVGAWGTGVDLGGFGRGQAPQPMPALGISGLTALAPLRADHAWLATGDGPVRALVVGQDPTGAAATDVIDVDAGRLLQRIACGGLGTGDAAVACAPVLTTAGFGWAPARAGEVVATRGAQMLVRVSPGAATVLDATGVRALVAFGDREAVLGDAAILAIDSAGTVRRFALPPPWPRRLRTWRATGVSAPAELRDLPPRTRDFSGLAAPDPTGDVTALALDPDDPATLYAAVEAFAGAPLVLARVDLRTRAWRWQKRDACPETARALAVLTEVIVCAGAGVVRASDKEGGHRWDWRGGGEGFVAAGDIIVARDAGGATVLEAATARALGSLASSDGAGVRAAVVTLGDATWLVAVERGRLVARLPHAALAPVWSRAVAGTVHAVTAAGDAVLVELDDGDAYRIAVQTGAVLPVAGLGLRWTAYGDTLVGQTAGGPIPPADLSWLPPPPRPPPGPSRPPPQLDLESAAPIASHPWPAPPPLAPSIQLTFYDPTGGVRTRNDFALRTPGRVASVRGPAGSAIVLTDGVDALVLDPASGDAVSRVALPDGAPFSSVVDGKPVAGAIIGSPLRLVLF